MLQPHKLVIALWRPFAMLPYKLKLCAILTPKRASFTTLVTNERQCNKVSQDLAVPRILSPLALKN